MKNTTKWKCAVCGITQSIHEPQFQVFNKKGKERPGLSQCSNCLDSWYEKSIEIKTVRD